MERIRNLFFSIFLVLCGVISIGTIAYTLMMKSQKDGTSMVINFWFVGFLLLAVIFLPRLFQKISAIGEIPPRTYRMTLLAIILLGFLLRLVAVLVMPYTPISDYGTMFEAAKGVARGDYSAFAVGTYFHRFPHITFFTLTAGMIMKLFGEHLLLIQLCSLFLKTAAIFVMALIGKEIFGKKGSLLCAFFLALFPADIFYTVVFAMENFALLFLELSVYFLIRAYKASDWKHTAAFMTASGSVLAVGTLFRNVAPFYLAAYVVGILLVFSKKCKWQSILALLVSFLVVYQAASLSLYHSGVTEYKLTQGAEPYSVYLLIGSNFDTYGMYSEDDHEVYFEADGDRAQINHLVWERLSKRISEHPERILPLFAIKTCIMWMDGSFAGVFWAYSNNGTEGDKPLFGLFMALCGVFYFILLAMTFFGMRRNRERNPLFLLMLVILSTWGGLCLLEVQPRYTYSVAYLFIPMAVSFFYLPKVNPFRWKHLFRKN